MSRKLRTKQIKAARLVLENYSANGIARELKIRPETLSRWKKLPAFKKIIEQVTQSELEEARCQFVHLVDASLAALWSVVKGRHCDPVRLKAALSVLKLAGIERISVPNVSETVDNAPKQEQNAPASAAPNETPGQTPPAASCRML